MGVYKAAARKANATVVVKGKPKFPMKDKAHARVALSRIDQAKPALTASQRAKVRARAHKILGSKKGAS